MTIVSQRITIIRVRKPQKNINEELKWFGNSIGLFNDRDKDKSMFRIFLELLKSNKTRHYLNSDEIAAVLSLSRGTVVHHLNKLMDAGIVIHDSGRYMLRVDNLEELVAEIRADISRTLDDLGRVAKDIDETLGL